MLFEISCSDTSKAYMGKRIAFMDNGFRRFGVIVGIMKNQSLLLEHDILMS